MALDRRDNYVLRDIYDGANHGYIKDSNDNNDSNASNDSTGITGDHSK